LLPHTFIRVLKPTTVLLGIAVLCANLSAAPSPEAHRLTLDDLLSLEPIGETALSPDGKIFATVRASQVVLLPAEGGWPMTLTSSNSSKSGLSWSPDGTTLAFASQGSIWTVSVSGGQPRRLTHSSPGEGDPRQAGDRSPRWSPRGDWILFETGRRGHSDIAVISPDGLSENIVTHTNGDTNQGAWSPDATQIAYTERAPAYFSGKLEVVNFDARSGRAGEPITLYTSPVDRGGGWALRRPSWSPDGRTLAIVLQERVG
jgi:Tol biopolymer transport system component